MPYKSIKENEQRIDKLEGVVKSLLQILLECYTDRIALGLYGKDHSHETIDPESLDRIEKLLKDLEK